MRLRAPLWRALDLPLLRHHLLLHELFLHHCLFVVVHSLRFRLHLGLFCCRLSEGLGHLRNALYERGSHPLGRFVTAHIFAEPIKGVSRVRSEGL
jgi:hypothetical protein